MESFICRRVNKLRHLGSNFADAVEAPLGPGAHPIPPLAGVVQVLPHEHTLVVFPTEALFVRLALNIGILKQFSTLL